VTSLVRQRPPIDYRAADWPVAGLTATDRPARSWRFSWRCRLTRGTDETVLHPGHRES
jgi:hypothetical protein